MEINDIKKGLYKEKPTAKLIYKLDTVYIYEAFLQDETQILFHVPISDMGDLPFSETEQAQLLIRYIKQ